MGPCEEFGGIIHRAMQGEKGDRGAGLRPKIRRFVFMKGDPGPPGLKGEPGLSIIGPKGDRGAAGLPGR